jgi:cobalt/nickel transport system ATP-binding protein
MIPLLESKGIEFSYPERPVLKGIDFRIGEGEKIGLTGPNGAGKTTLLRIFMGLERPQAGEILFRGIPCQKEEDWRQLRREVGLVFQDPDDQLFCPTVEEDLACHC